MGLASPALQPAIHYNVRQVTEETDFIVFHLSGMNITSKTINEFLKIKRLLFFPDREQVGVYHRMDLIVFY